MATETKLKAIIEAEDRASAVLGKFNGAVGEVRSGLNKLQPVMLALTAATGVLTWQGKKAFDEFQLQEIALAKLTEASRNASGATKAQIQDLANYATQLQKVTRFGDEQIMAGQAMLATFRLNTEEIKKATPSMLNLAEMTARLGGGMLDAEGAAKLLGLALEGQAGRLRQAGISLTDQQLELMKTADRSERLALVTQIITENTGNMAEAVGTTAAGKMAQFSNAIGDVREEIGRLIAQELTPLLIKLTEWFSKQENVDKIINTSRITILTFVEILRTMKGIFDGIVDVLSEIISKFMIMNDWIKRMSSTGRGLGTFLFGNPLQAAGTLGRMLGFAEGGIVPGPRGSPQMAVVHGGETIIPPDKQTLNAPITININNPTVRSDRDINALTETIIEALSRRQKLAKMGI